MRRRKESSAKKRRGDDVRTKNECGRGCLRTNEKGRAFTLLRKKERDVCEFLCSFGAVFLFEKSFSTGQSPFHQDEKAHKRRRIVFFGLERSWAKKPLCFRIGRRFVGLQSVTDKNKEASTGCGRAPQGGAAGRLCRGRGRGGAAAREKGRRGAKRKTRR